MREKVKDILNLDNSFFSFMKKIGWVFLLNLLFLVTSIPIVTIGASTTAMYTVINKLIEEREFQFFKDYFRAFRENFVLSTCMWLLVAVVLLIVWLDVTYVFAYMTGIIGIFMKVGTVLLAVIFCMLANAIFPVIAKFDITLKEIIPTVIGMSVQHILLGLESVVFTIVVFGGCYLIIQSGFFLGLFILFPLAAFGIHAFMQSYLYQKIFEDYIDEEESTEEVW